MLIDIHVHATWTRHLVDGKTRPMAPELIEMMDQAGIDMAVVMSVVSPECRTYYNSPESTIEVCRQYPQRLVPFCSVDPRWVKNRPDSDLRPVLETYRDAGCKGVGEYMANLPFDDPYNMNVFHQVEEIGLPLTFHVGPTIGGCYGCYDELGLPRLEKVMKECPDLRLLGHSQPFWAEISADVTEDTRKGYPTGPVTPGRLVELFRQYPNLHGDLSAGSGFNAITRDPEFGYQFMEEFQDRLLFGTDIAGTGQELPIVPFFRKLQEEKLISGEAYEKIAWRNAKELLDLDVPDAA